jgi:putative nucleotidyltransferase with HDIG domain
MRLPGSGEPDSDPSVQRMLEESRVRQHQQLHGRERLVVLLSAAAFLGTAVPFAIFVPGGRSLDPAVAVVLVALYMLAARIEFHTGSGWAVPTQLVFVPMLFLLPVSSVPLFVAVALILFRLPEYLGGTLEAGRAVVRMQEAWYSIGPAAVLALAGAGEPTWSDWPIYLAALGAQFGTDFVSFSVREHFGYGFTISELLKGVSTIYLVDALLSPIGLLAAFASVGERWAFLLVVPLLGLLAIFSREREARIENALTLSQAYRGTAHLLGELLSTSDDYTGKHSRSVVVFAHQVAETMGLDESAMRDVEFGALLHDVGKISVPNELINKPGKLTEQEWAVMRAHTTEGERMLERIGGVLEDVGHVVRSHHEHWDGSGYPDGLRGDQIPIAARIISACDAFHAMTSDRSYRLAMTREDAIEELRAHSGTQFDPAVVEALVTVVHGWEDVDGPSASQQEEARTAVRSLIAANPVVTR